MTNSSPWWFDGPIDGLPSLPIKTWVDFPWQTGNVITRWFSMIGGWESQEIDRSHKWAWFVLPSPKKWCHMSHMGDMGDLDSIP